MNLHVFQHVPHGGPAAIGDWAKARGYTQHTTHWYQAGVNPPHPSQVDLLVIMGGPMNVGDTAEHPWLLEEKAFLQAYLATGRPVVGVCLGGQLLAEALGAKVSKNPLVEKGWYAVSLTAEARALWPQLPAQLTPLHWHQDTFSLPKEAARLFTNATCTNQGFLARKNLLGLQFHIEATERSTRAIVEANAESLAANPTRSPFVCTAEQALAGAQEHSEAMRAALFTILDSITARAPAPVTQPA